MFKDQSLKLFNKIFYHSESKRFGWMILFFLILQQIIAASSSFWISQFATNIQNGINWKLPLALFLMSMILPYLPGAIALHFANLWTMCLQKVSTERYLDQLIGRVDLVNNNKMKLIHTAVIGKEIPQFIHETIPFGIQYASQWLNLGFQMVTVSLILGSNYFIAFLAGVFIVYCLLNYTKSDCEKYSKQKQNSLTHLSALLGDCWGNLTIANEYNLKIWQDQVELAYKDCRDNNSKLSLHKEFGGALVSLIGVIPFLLYLGIHFISGNPTTREVITLSVLLPRIFQLFNVGASVAILSKNVSLLVGRWQDIEEKCDLLEGAFIPLQHRINESAISIHSNCSGNLTRLDNFSTEKLNELNGYFTVTGPNGSGKSSLLLSLKERMGKDALYLPNTAELAFATMGNRVLSTGQRMLLALEEITNLPEGMRPRVLLLDEWDANLDHSSRQRVISKLRTLSVSGVIIEICHQF